MTMREIRIPGLRRVLRVSWSDDALRRDVAEEIAFHIDARTAELTRLGATPGAARARAEAEFGDRGSTQRELVTVDRRRAGHQKREDVFMSFVDDVRYAARGLLRRPALLTITTLALSVGIAANAIMFGVVDQLILRPPSHVAAPETMRRIYFQHRDRMTGSLEHGAVSTFPVFDALIQHVPQLDVVVYSFVEKYSLGSGTDARQVEVQQVSGNYFGVLGVRSQLGRTLLPSDDVYPQGERVVVVSERFWQRQLGADSGAIGQVMHINNEPYTIVGVAPRAFSGLDRLNTDMWVPLSAMAPSTAGPEWHDKPNNWWLQAVARVRAGSDDAVATAATRVYRDEVISWNESHQDTTGGVVLGSIISTRTPDGLSSESKVSLWLMGVSVIVLIIACANVANLLIARMYQRRREIAVRLALGISRLRLLQLLLTEAALLAAVSTALALLIALGASRVVQNVLLPGIVWSDSVIDGRILLFTLAATVVCILLAGLAPALSALGTRVSENLKAAAGSVTGRTGVRHALLLVQAALSIVLLIGAGLFVKSLNNVVTRDVGIDLDKVLLVRADMGRLGFSAARREETYQLGRERVSAIPGVTHATLVRQMVPTASASGMSLKVPGVTERPKIAGGGPYYGVVGADYFPTMGASMVRGRNFLPSEERTPNRSLIINKIVADAYFPGADPIGQCARLGSDSVCSTVVGVVENMMLFSLVRDDRALLFVPLAHQTFGEKPIQAMVVRVERNIDAIAPLVRKEMQALAPNMPFVQVQPYTQRVASQVRPWRLGATMFTAFGIIALVIAAVGLYSVMAYWVAQRTHEIGVRMALGAQRGDVVRLVAWQSSRPVIAGVVIGSLVAWFASRWIIDLLYETSTTDPFVYVGAAALLVIAGLVASIVPARRSAAVDPARAIRTE
ncbi:MAG TPA: ADOP family duplicated permease [Gemmatimonadaceae bacterium]|nr:ADOP family duplicated permease [Gemmatimonadaceae bacterium]